MLKLSTRLICSNNLFCAPTYLFSRTKNQKYPENIWEKLKMEKPYVADVVPKK